MKMPLRETARIEPAHETDLPALSRLTGLIWRACYPGIITNTQIEYMLARMYSLETLRQEILLENICYRRLLVMDEFVGFGSYGPAGPRAFKLHKLYLDPKWHHRGLGRLLLKHCEGEVRKLGAGRLILNVNKRNTQAITFYQRNGFAIVESEIVNIGGGFVMDDHVMAKELLPS